MMMTGDYAALSGKNPEEKMRPLGIVKGKSIDLRILSSISARYGVAIYLFFEPDLARNVPLELVIYQYKDVPEDMRPYIRVEAFLQFIYETDPTFSEVMEKDPVMVRIVTIGQIAVDPTDPPLVYVTGLMPYLDEMQL